MSTSYIPAKDADLDNWLANFSTRITATPTTYGLTSGDATTIAASVATWSAAYTAAINPSTRTPVTVAAKDTAKVSVVSLCRAYGQQVANNAAVAVQAKIDLGLNPRTNTPTPIPTPTTQPVLTLVASQSLLSTLRYRDATSIPTSRAKPAGTIACLIYGVTSATPITDPSALSFKMLATKSPFDVEFDSADQGKKWYYAARWVTRTGKMGPFSAIGNLVVA